MENGLLEDVVPPYIEDIPAMLVYQHLYLVCVYTYCKCCLLILKCLRVLQLLNQTPQPTPLRFIKV